MWLLHSFSFYAMQNCNPKKNPITMQLIWILTLVDVGILSIVDRAEWQEALERILHE